MLEDVHYFFQSFNAQSFSLLFMDWNKDSKLTLNASHLLSRSEILAFLYISNVLPIHSTLIELNKASN